MRRKADEMKSSRIPENNQQANPKLHNTRHEARVTASAAFPTKEKATRGLRMDLVVLYALTLLFSNTAITLLAIDMHLNMANFRLFGEVTESDYYALSAAAAISGMLVATTLAWRMNRGFRCFCYVVIGGTVTGLATASVMNNILDLAPHREEILFVPPIFILAAGIGSILLVKFARFLVKT